MAKEQKITPIRQFNIDIIRAIRLELDVTGDELSTILEKGLKYIGNIESPSHDSFHTDHGMNQIAIYFTKIAKQRQAELDVDPSNKIKLKTEYTIYDFYPKKSLSEELQVKTSTPIPREGGVTATLNAVLETSDFFDTDRSLKEVIEYFNQLQGQTWQGSDLTSALERAQKKGKLKFSYLPDGAVRYQKG